MEAPTAEEGKEWANRIREELASGAKVWHVGVHPLCGGGMSGGRGVSGWMGGGDVQGGVTRPLPSPCHTENAVVLSSLLPCMDRCTGGRTEYSCT